jgi:hypothetical protein
MPCIKLASYFNEDKNDLDGGILLTTLTQLKYSNLMIPPKKLNKNYIEEVISHALSWVIHTR